MHPRIFTANELDRFANRKRTPSITEHQFETLSWVVCRLRKNWRDQRQGIHEMTNRLLYRRGESPATINTIRVAIFNNNNAPKLSIIIMERFFSFSLIFLFSNPRFLKICESCIYEAVFVKCSWNLVSRIHDFYSIFQNSKNFKLRKFFKNSHSYSDKSTEFISHQIQERSLQIILTMFRQSILLPFR